MAPEASRKEKQDPAHREDSRRDEIGKVNQGWLGKVLFNWK